MINFINPLDLVLIILLLIIAGFGVYNGFINEFKKIISLFIATILSKLIVQYIPFLNNTLSPLFAYLIILVFLIYLTRLLFNLITHYIPSLEIDREVNGFMGGVVGLLKGLILISILLFIVDLSPIQDSIKSNQASILFRTCDNIKSFILE